MDDDRQSEYDALESTDDEDRLVEDDASPASPADDIESRAPIDEPSTDDGMDSDELYQEGVTGATNADDEEVDLDGDQATRIG